jgi:putative ABC transport system permease protein
MAFGPVFRSLLHQRGRFWLIALEVALTFAIVVNCVGLVQHLRAKFLRPSGLDEANLVVFFVEPFAPEYRDRDYRQEAIRRDLERIRAYPGVTAAAATSVVPLSGGGSASGRKAEGAVGDSVGTPYFRVSDGILEALGVRLVEGRAFEPADFTRQENEHGIIPDLPVIITKRMADVLFPDGGALGKRIEGGQEERRETNIVVGIVELMHNAWPNNQNWEERAMLVPGRPDREQVLQYMVRCAPGARDAVLAGLDEMLVGVDPGRIVSQDSLEEIKARTYGGELGLMKVLTGVVVLLVMVTAFGIVGLTSFSVAQRRREIGTRRALGATREDILRHFLLENWVITGTGLALGLGATGALNYALAKLAEAPPLDWKLVGGGMLLLWASGILAALVPALRAMRVAPVVATRAA